MDEEKILNLLKLKLGITTTIRDVYLLSLIQAMMSEVKDTLGIFLDANRMDHLHFLVDYAYFRYSNRESSEMPRHLAWRLHNLAVDTKGEKEDVE